MEHNIKFCMNCLIKTPHDKDGNCEICREQEENDKKEARAEIVNFAKEVSEYG